MSTTVDLYVKPVLTKELHTAVSLHILDYFVISIGDGGGMCFPLQELYRDISKCSAQGFWFA